MKYRSILLFTLTAAIPSWGADLKVIANPGVKATQISTDEVRRIFLATSTSLEGAHVEPVLAKRGAAHEAFLKEYVGKTDSALLTYYRSLVFTGKASMPKSFDSDADVAAYVAKTKGAIGYVSAEAETGDAKVLEVK
jgi:ABC-type phosphate transport system substrate-binding protein